MAESHAEPSIIGVVIGPTPDPRLLPLEPPCAVTIGRREWAALLAREPARGR